MEIVKLKKKSQPSLGASTPNLVNLGEDEDLNATSTNVDQPIGCKAEKENRKRIKKMDLDNLMLLNEIKEDRKKKILLFEEARDHDKQMLCLRQEELRIQKDKLRVQKEKVLIKQEKVRNEENKEERIMMINTIVLSPMLQEYYLQRQMEILARRSRIKQYILG